MAEPRDDWFYFESASSMPTCTILYFAWLRERTGLAEEALTLPADVHTVAGLIALLRSRNEACAAAFAEANRVRAAVNQVFAQPDTPIKAGDEIAFFPPVTGG